MTRDQMVQAVLEMFTKLAGRQLKQQEVRLINKAVGENINMFLKIINTIYANKSMDLVNDENQISIEAYLGRSVNQ